MGNKVYIPKAFVEYMEEAFHTEPICFDEIKNMNPQALGYLEGIRYTVSKIREMYEYQQNKESEEIIML